MSHDMMEQVGSSPSENNGNPSGTPSNPIYAPVKIPSVTNLLYANESAERSDEADDITVSPPPEEADESLIELSMSHVATKMKDPKTPAIEKAEAMEEMEGGGFFDSDLDTPPAADQPEMYSGEDQSTETLREKERVLLRTGDKLPIEQNYNKAGLSFENLPSPDLDSERSSVLPSTWHASPKQLKVERSEPQSSLAGVFSSRTRSRSSGADALKKFLPKGLPSMTNFLGSSHTNQGAKSPSFFGETRSNRCSISCTASPLRTEPSPQRRIYQTIVARPQEASRREAPLDTYRPKSVRRVTSDDSLLYHSLSRASSLGDDTRFESQKEQVNSRAKAIRDSLQDRSSFRLPQMPSMSMPSMKSMPSMPSMPRVPNFGFNKSFLNTSTLPTRRKIETDAIPDILAENITKKNQPPLPDSANSPQLNNAAASQPRAVIDAKPGTDGQLLDPFERVLESLTGDIVIMGGYRGSILRSTKTRRQVWVPVKVGLNIRKVDLEVGLEPEDEERMEETIYPSGMLQNIGPVDISKRLFKRLNDCDNAKNGTLRVWDYGYDWRLSPRLLARKLTSFLENLPCNQISKDGSVQQPGGATVIAHSLGGLITRHVVNHRPELFAGVVYAGVPQACVNILGPLRNGDAVLLSQRVLTAQVNFTLRTSFVLLPEDGGCFVDINTKEKYPVDFFNIDDWIKYRWSPCTDPPLPPKNPPQPGGLGRLTNMSSSFLSMPPTKKFGSGLNSPSTGSFPNSPRGNGTSASTSSATKTTLAADVLRSAEHGTDRTLAPQIGNMGNNSNVVSKGQSSNSSVSTAVTIPRDKAIAYLTRTLAETKQFKSELHHRPALSESNRYPPLALIYGKHIPTCCGAKVDGIDSIACSDVYENLAFASGDGVCLAKEAMLPVGYKACNGGRISSERGHVTLLGDLNAVGRALESIIRGRGKGIGLGVANYRSNGAVNAS